MMQGITRRVCCGVDMVSGEFHPLPGTFGEHISVDKLIVYSRFQCVPHTI